MKRVLWFAGLMVATIVPAAAQIQIGLDDLAAKAKESVNISLDSNMLRLAGSFFSGGKAADAGIQNLLSELKNITVRSFTFDEEGQYKMSDLDPVRSQLRKAGWGKIIGVNEKRETTEIYSKPQGDQIGGLAVLAAEPKELTVVYIEGNIDLSKLAALAGHFGIPDLPIPGEKPPAAELQKR
jgi:hypothetical protein